MWQLRHAIYCLNNAIIGVMNWQALAEDACGDPNSFRWNFNLFSFLIKLPFNTRIVPREESIAVQKKT